MDRTQTILHAISKRGYCSYLELGCRKDITFNAVKCARKVGVDSIEGGTVRMTTDDFFAQNAETFDVVFIDAYHHHNQVFKDFQNSLNALNKGGVVILHDCSPADLSFESQSKCGTAWRAFTRHIRTRPDLDAIVGNYDHGVGVVRVAQNQDVLTLDKGMDELAFKDLSDNREQYLRLRTWEQVQDWL